MIWGPDTCRCSLEFDGVNDIEHFTGVISRCEFHTKLSDQEVAEAVLVENKTKNRVRYHILTDDEFGFDDEDEKGNIVRKFKKGMEPTITLDENREVVVTMPAGKQINKQRVDNLLEDKLSTDEVLSEFVTKKSRKIE